MKKITVIVIALILLLNIGTAMAKPKQMEDGVPVWTEETVRQYALDYIEGTSMKRLWGYYDLQIRRYMPEVTYRALLNDLHWSTGDFVALGSYRTFDENENQLRVHVLHLCMEKQDLDMYFTHKNKEDDWEVMALEFAFANKEEAPNRSTAAYTTISSTVGSNPYLLNATITLPDSASTAEPVVGCILVHDDGPFDQDMKLGETKLFADIADEFGKHGIATIRYDKRTYTYPDYETMTPEDEIVEDAVSAAKILSAQSSVDSDRILVIGVGFGGEMCAKIAEQSDGVISGIITIGACGLNKLQQEYNAYEALLDKDTKKEITQMIRYGAKYSDEEVANVVYFGRTGCYYRYLLQNDQMKILEKLRIPTYVVQGRNDTYVDEKNGKKTYSKTLGISSQYASYTSYRGLNHILMNDLETDGLGASTYANETHLDLTAAQDIRTWIKTEFPTAEEVQ